MRRTAEFFAVFAIAAGCLEVGSSPDSIRFLLPDDGATVTEPEVLAVTGAGISRVTIEVDGDVVLDTTAQPFEWTLDPADYEGQTVVTVVARKEGVDHSMSVTLNITAGGGGGAGPVVFLTPAEGAVVDTPTSLAVQGGGVVSVDFRMDGTRIRLDDTSPFSWVLNPAAVSEGDHQIVIEARLSGGGSQSKTVGVETVAPEGEPAPPPGVVAAIQDLKPGEWYEIPNTRLDAVAADPSPGGSITGVIGAWSSGAYDTKRHRLIVWGGGHGDYAGNEIYVFSMSSFRWKRLNEPSAFPPGDENNSSLSVSHPDGAPISRHSYDYLEYMPGVDRFFVGGGSALWIGGQLNDSTTYLFNFDTLEWTTHDPCVANSIGATSALGPDGRVWQHGAYGDSAVLIAFDGTTGKWTRYADYGSWIGYQRTAEIDPIANKYVLIGEGDLRIWDLSNPNQQHVRPTTTGDAPPSLYHPGVAWDPETKTIVVWGGGSTVYSLDTGTLKWTAHATTGVNTTPPDHSGAGTNGRWRYVPSLKLFVVVNRTNGNVFVYKHS
jgi:hypothetical protein